MRSAAAGGGNLSVLQWASGMVVTGIVVHVPAQLKVGTSMSSNERENMGANGIDMLAVLQLEVRVQSSSVSRFES